MGVVFLTVLNETDVLNKCISIYVTCENNRKFKGRKEYYNSFGNKLYTYIASVYSVKYDTVIENKQYKDMLQKFFNETVKEHQLSQKACFDFGEYFYQKFLEDIKRHRLFLQGSKYSNNKKAFVDVR